MKKQILFAACTLFAASALLMTSCQQAEEPIANDPTDQAGPMTRAATLGNFYRVVYVEVNDVNPLNAGEYLLSVWSPRLPMMTLIPFAWSGAMYLAGFARIAALFGLL